MLSLFVVTWSLYRITNRINGKLYFGQTIGTPEQRWKGHCTRSGCKALSAAIALHGPESFELELVALRFNQEEADQTERDLINFHRTTEKAFGYNLSAGGVGFRPIHCKNGHLLVDHRVGKSRGCATCRQKRIHKWLPPDGSSPREYYTRKMAEHVAKIDEDPDARRARLDLRAARQREYNAKPKTPEQRERNLASKRRDNHKRAARIAADPVLHEKELARHRDRHRKAREVKVVDSN